MRNRGSLAHLLDRAVPGVGDVEAVLRSELRALETYAGLDVDVDDLLAQGRCARVDVSDKRNRDFLLFAMPAGRPATEEVRQLWQGEKVPAGKALQEELVKRGLVRPEELERRQARRADARKWQKDAEQRAKKSRTGQVRNWKNDHLGTSAELEAGAHG